MKACNYSLKLFVKPMISAAGNEDCNARLVGIAPRQTALASLAKFEHPPTRRTYMRPALYFNRRRRLNLSYIA